MMKNICVYLVLMLFYCKSNAQPPRHERDTTRAGFFAAETELIASPIVRGTRQPIELNPVTTRMCFDNVINFEMLWGTLNVRQALFMNNADGYIAYTKPGVNGDGAIDMIMPEVADFQLGVFGFKGNTYNYHNRKDDHNIIRHEVMTGNTETHKYVTADAMSTAPLERKNMQRSYCGGMANAMAYKLADQPTVWYLYGDRYPAQLHVRKYFGGFGIGVIRADEGVYVVMELSTGNNHVRILNIEKMMQCFDPQPFVAQEDAFRTKQRAALQQEAAKIEQHALDAGNARHCVAERLAIVNHERELNRQAFRDLDSTNHGNIYQDKTTQKAFIAMMDPLTLVESGILQCNLSICGIESAEHPGPDAADRLACQQNLLQRLNSLSQQMRALNDQYANNLAAAQAKKSQLYLASMREVHCD